MADLLLGSVVVALAGTPVRATKNRDDPTVRIPTQAILFQALKGNVGVVYVGHKGMVRATGVNVALQLPAPVSAVTGPFPSGSIGVPGGPAALNAADYFIDADNANDGVLVTVVSQ